MAAQLGKYYNASAVKTLTKIKCCYGQGFLLATLLFKDDSCSKLYDS